MHPVLTPQRIATEPFTDADAAVARLIEIYERNTRFLRESFEAYVNGEVGSTRVRATYPFVRILISTHARLDSRLSYGFVAGPGIHETTVTRPDLFRTYLTEQITLLIENHGVPVEIGESGEPIPSISPIDATSMSKRGCQLAQSCPSSDLCATCLTRPILPLWTTQSPTAL